MPGNARLTYWARKQIPIRYRAGWSQRAIAQQLGTSTATISKWWRRFEAHPEGQWFRDRSSRAHRSPNQTAPAREAEILSLRAEHKLGPARIAWRLDMAPSTVHRVLVRGGCNRLVWMDRPSGRVVRRIETTHPGELVNIDIKKLSRVPDGGGWRVIGRQAARPGRDRRSWGISMVHSAIDHYSSIAYSEVLDDERAHTAAQFWGRAAEFFAELGITIEAVLSDNGSRYRSREFTSALAGIEHRFIRPYTPRTNGKVERFSRTLLEEWAYVRPHLQPSPKPHQPRRSTTAPNNLPDRYS